MQTIAIHEELLLTLVPDGRSPMGRRLPSRFPTPFKLSTRTQIRAGLGFSPRQIPILVAPATVVTTGIKPRP